MMDFPAAMTSEVLNGLVRVGERHRQHHFSRPLPGLRVHCSVEEKPANTVFQVCLHVFIPHLRTGGPAAAPPPPTALGPPANHS